MDTRILEQIILSRTTANTAAAQRPDTTEYQRVHRELLALAQRRLRGSELLRFMDNVTRARDILLEAR